MPLLCIIDEEIVGIGHQGICGLLKGTMSDFRAYGLQIHIHNSIGELMLDQQRQTE